MPNTVANYLFRFKYITWQYKLLAIQMQKYAVFIPDALSDERLR